MGKIIKWARNLSQAFPKEWIYFRDCHHYFLGTHTLFSYTITDAKMYENQIDLTALNTQFAMAADSRIEWISPTSRPAGRWNDPKQFKEHLDSYDCDRRDITCTDGVFLT